MSYAAPSDLKARAGRLSAAWSNTSVPSDPTDLQAFLDQAAAKIDAQLAVWTTVTPVTGTAATALKGLNASMSAITALRATFPSKTGPQEAEELIASLEREVYGPAGSTGEWGLLEAGKHPAVILLRQNGDVPSGASFWGDEGSYGEFVTPEDVLAVNPQMLPFFSRLSRW